MMMSVLAMRNYLNCANDMEDFRKNAHGWKPTEDDYRLIFREVDGLWVEITNNLPRFYNMTLADYLSQVNIVIDDDCQFCRIRRGDERWEYRNNGGYIRIDYDLIQ